jgi:hypothetical protein
LKQYGKELIESYVDPMVIHHPKGHTVPRLGEMLLSFLFILFMMTVDSNELVFYTHTHYLSNFSKIGCVINIFLFYFQMIKVWIPWLVLLKEFKEIYLKIRNESGRWANMLQELRIKYSLIVYFYFKLLF